MLSYRLRSEGFIRWIDSPAYGTKMPRAKPSDVEDTPAAIPPSSEQRAIAAFLDRETAKIEVLVAKVREAIDRMKEFRTALISATVTGKIDVRPLAEAPARGASSAAGGSGQAGAEASLDNTQLTK